MPILQSKNALKSATPEYEAIKELKDIIADRNAVKIFNQTHPSLVSYLQSKNCQGMYEGIKVSGDHTDL